MQERIDVDLNKSFNSKIKYYRSCCITMNVKKSRDSLIGLKFSFSNNIDTFLDMDTIISKAPFKLIYLRINKDETVKPRNKQMENTVQK